MNKLKIAIVGGGIPGFYLAWKLSEKGHSVTLFEKKEEIGFKPCSGLYSERIFDFIPSGKIAVQNEIDSARLYFPSKTVTLNFSKKILVMSHYLINELLHHLANQQGAKVILDSRIEDIPSGFDRVIGCDGANSKIRESLGEKEPTFIPSLISFTSKKDYSNFVQVWPQKEGGFIWKVPRGEETEYGILMPSSKIKKRFEKFLKKNRIELGELKVAPIPRGLQIPKNSSVTLLGDAAGMTKPWSGGGVIWSLIGANFLIECFPDFIKYRRKIRTFFGPKILISKIAKKMIYFSGFKLPYLLPRRTKIESDFLI